MGGESQVEKRQPDAFERRLSAGVEMTLPEEIRQWLGRALLLYGVPFNYLVPDERMLPAESIRFFYLDPGWLKCLLEGACSVGRTTTREESVDQHLTMRFLEEAPSEAAAVRQGTAASTQLTWPLTGFLLRSRVVEGWQGLEMTAWGQRDGTAHQLTALRIDRLGPDVMLAIFNGKLQRIVVKQPPEGMHFGAAPTGDPDGYQKISLRRIDPVGDAAAVQACKNAVAEGQEPCCEPGDQISGAPLGLPMREDGVGRVVAVRTGRASDGRSAVGELEERLGGATGREAFTSAEFALQMVDSPGMAIFTATREPSE